MAYARALADNRQLGCTVHHRTGVVALANTQNNVVGRINLPNVPLSDSTLTTAAISTAVALVLLTLLSALLGGTTGRRYHDKIDNWRS